MRVLLLSLSSLFSFLFILPSPMVYSQDELSSLKSINPDAAQKIEEYLQLDNNDDYKHQFNINDLKIDSSQLSLILNYLKTRPHQLRQIRELQLFSNNISELPGDMGDVLKSVTWLMLNDNKNLNTIFEMSF